LFQNGQTSTSIQTTQSRSMTVGVQPRGKEATAMTDGPGTVRWRDRLPRGQTLPPETWARRHRSINLIAWAHVPALIVFPLATGRASSTACLAVPPIAVFAALGGRRELTRRYRAAAVTLSLLTSSAMLVYFWDGKIEAHFHFFVMVALLATYEEWFPY